MAINSFPINAAEADIDIQHIILFYRKRYGQAVYLNGSNCSIAIQKQFHVDIVVGENESHITEVKTVKQRDTPLTRIYLEHLSCSIPGYRTPGWIITSKADTLTFAFMLKDGSSDTLIGSMPRIQSFYKSADKSRWGEPHVNEGENRSSGYNVPIIEIRQAIPDMERYRISPDGSYRKIW